MALSMIPALVSAQAAGKADKPNIVIILADDLGWGDVGFHGSEIMTPHLDSLASEGIILDHFYTAPICSPTRAGLLTGRYPNRFGLRETVIPPWSAFGVDTGEVFLPEILEQAGYRNRAVIGKWHLGHSQRMYLPLQRGFTHFYGHYNGAIDYFTHEREGELDWHDDEKSNHDKGYSTDLITAEAVKSIRDYTAEKAPFFLYVAYNAPHVPLQAKNEDLLLYGDTDSVSKRQTYSAMVTCMDRGIGQIMAALNEAGVAENTIVLFFSDNGAAPHGGGSSGELKGTKFQEWEGGVRSPALISWPEGFQGRRTIDQVTGYIDVLPTMLEAAGIDEQKGKKPDGISILPVLKNEVKAIDRGMYLGYGSIIAGNKWKLVKAGGGNPRMELTEDALYNIMEDPAEKKDLKEQYPAVYQHMKVLLAPLDSIKPAREVKPYGYGRKKFKAPEEWKIKE